jgi:hypothetical protein
VNDQRPGAAADVLGTPACPGGSREISRFKSAASLPIGEIVSTLPTGAIEGAGFDLSILIEPGEAPPTHGCFRIIRFRGAGSDPRLCDQTTPKDLSQSGACSLEIQCEQANEKNGHASNCCPSEHRCLLQKTELHPGRSEDASMSRRVSRTGHFFL